MEGSKKICVLGSANADHFLYVKKIPAVGETIQSQRYFTANGGKGANQAVSVGKLAGNALFLGQVGDDDAKGNLEEEMLAANVQLHWRVLKGKHTGMAYITVEESGENCIVIYGGTNMDFATEELEEDFREVIDRAEYLLLQKEVPMGVNLSAAKYAHSQGKTVILDCGGRDDPIPEELLDNITYISPNETELLRLHSSIVIEEGKIDLPAIAAEIRSKLIAKHPNLSVLLKLGSKGSAIITSEVVVKGEVVTAINASILQDYSIVDTVGAGDCFTGAFAVRHAELDWSDPAAKEGNYRKAMEFGNSAAFLCITKSGAMPSMPRREDVDAFIQKY
jgi:ribokinase